MHPFDNTGERHKLVTLRMPGRQPAQILCLLQKDGAGEDGYYVLAKCEGRALRWRSMIRDNAVRRLRDEFVQYIAESQDVDALDIATIFLCATEVSKA